jgi:hypothetical protein
MPLAHQQPPIACGRRMRCVLLRLACEAVKYGQGWIRTSEGISQQIYSLPRLAASVPTRNEGVRGSPFAVLGLRFRTALNS